jgi:hypothetical protein
MGMSARGDLFENRRLRLDGARLPHVVVLAVTPSGLLIDAPADPPIETGATRHIEVHGLRGVTVVAESYPSWDASRMYYAIAIIELDEGLIAAIADCVGHFDCAVHVSI